MNITKQSSNNASKYHQLSGNLDKLSTSIFVGYQKKFFQILQNGTKIAYKNLQENQFDEKNTFLIKDVVVCEAEQDFSFTLQTPRRVFMLKAENQQAKTLWMKAITKIRKQIIRKKFKNTIKKSPFKNNNILSSTDHTAPNSSSLILNLLNQTQHSVQSSNPHNMTVDNIRLTQRSIRMNSARQPNPQNDGQIKKQMKKILANIPQDYVKYNIFVGNLKTKIQNLFMTTYNTNTYILISSKTLYPSIVQSMLEDNLTNMMLPPWAEVNKMYKLPLNNTNVNNNQIKSENLINTNSLNGNPKLLFEVGKIIDLEQGEQKSSIKIRTQENVNTIYCQTVEQKQRLKKVLQVSIDNFRQVAINNKLSRKNYDRLIWSYFNNYEQFLTKTKQIISKFIPSNHQYQPEVVIKFVDIILPFIQQFTFILKNKKQPTSPTQIILHLLKQLHQQVKIHIKLTWDTSYSTMKGSDILKYLNALAAYHSVIKEYLTDLEFMKGMKELSKIYVRQSWINFEDIILGIVQQEKKLNLFQDEDNEYVQTNSIIDLFKFIYQVFELAAPCWEHKLHLHNVQKLMSRAISVFINELKAIVDESIIANKQLIAMANNYFRFSITIDEFYNEKFLTLQQKTKQSYNKLKTDYKQLSMIILDKLAFDIRADVKRYFEKNNFYKIDADKIYQMLKQRSNTLEAHSLHNLFIKRFYQKIFSTIRECILHTLQKEITSKKKHNVSKIIEHVDKISFDLVDISNMLYKGKPKIDKELNEINTLLLCENQNELITLLKGSCEDIRAAYMNIIQLREDYYMGAPLYYALNDDNLDKNSVTGGKSVSGSLRGDGKNSMIRNMRMTRSRDRRASFSSYYMMNDFDTRSMMSKSDQQSVNEAFKLISQGYLMKAKATNKSSKIWQKQYFRLRNGTIYFYSSQKSQKCQNSIPVFQIMKLQTIKQQNLTFKIIYISLNRQKQIELKCQTIELRDRWIDSINLEIRRVQNDEKVNKQKLKLQEKNKNYLIIDYEQLMNGRSYFSYNSSNMK